MKKEKSLVGNSRKRKANKRRPSPLEDDQASSSQTTTTSSFGLCENVSNRYEKVGRVGEGTYGVVYKARDTETGKYVALKRCIPHHEAVDGFPLTTLREINALRLCSRHDNIVELQEVAVSSSGGVFLVCEYCSQDLGQIIDDYYPKHRQSPFNQSQIKTLMCQLFSALAFCHSHALIHRDIKPSNMLYNQSGKLKLCDFGLSRHISQEQRLTPNVVSLWYRAPELLLQDGYNSYTFAIDLWAVGCVLGELLQGYPLLDGRNETEQITKMISCLGLPPKRLYDSNTKCARLVEPRSPRHHDLWDRFSFLSTQSLTLLTKLLEYDPKERYTAQDALDSDYFTSQPLQSNDMPRFDKSYF